MGTRVVESGRMIPLALGMVPIEQAVFNESRSTEINYCNFYLTKIEPFLFYK